MFLYSLQLGRGPGTPAEPPRAGKAAAPLARPALPRRGCSAGAQAGCRRRPRHEAEQLRGRGGVGKGSPGGEAGERRNKKRGGGGREKKKEENEIKTDKIQPERGGCARGFVAGGGCAGAERRGGSGRGRGAPTVPIISLLRAALARLGPARPLCDGAGAAAAPAPPHRTSPRLFWFGFVCFGFFFKRLYQPKSRRGGRGSSQLPRPCPNPLRAGAAPARNRP